MTTPSFDPSQLVQGQVTVRNTGNTSTTLAVRVTVGSGGILGFSPEGPARTVITPTPVPPGSTATLPISIRLPGMAGLKAFRVESGPADPSGGVARIIDSQVFSNLAEVAGAAPATLPLNGVTPTIPTAPTPTAAQLAATFAESLGAPGLQPVPGTVTQGEIARGGVQLPTGASFSFSPQLRILLLDANNNTIRTILQQTVSLAPRQSISQAFTINTLNLPLGSYGIRVSLLAPNGQVLLDPVTFPGALGVVAPRVVAAPEPVILEAFMPERIPGVAVLTATIGPSVATLGQAYVGNILITNTDTRAHMLETVRMTLRFPDNSFTVNFGAPLIGSGPAALPLIASTNLEPGGSRRVALRDFLSTDVHGPAAAGQGSWEVGGELDGGQFQRLAGGPFTIRPAAAPAPIEPEPTPTGPTPTTIPVPVPSAARLVTVGTPTLTPTTGPAGRSILGRWTVRNAGGQSIRAFLFLDGPGGGFGNALRVDPGETVALQIPGVIPSSLSGPTRTYGLALRDERQRTGPSLEVRTFQLRIDEPAPAPAPTPVPTPTPALTGIRAGGITVEQPRAVPFFVEPGGTTQLQFFLVNNSGLSGTLNMLVFGRDPAGQTRGTGRTSVSIPRTGSARATVPLTLPSTAPPGNYRIQVFVWDDRTFVAGDPSTFVFQGFFNDVFAVSG